MSVNRQLISQLARQAWDWAEANSSEPEVSIYDTWGLKFAELLINDAIHVASQQRDPAALNYKLSERFVDALKQHFGVKE